MKTFRALRNGAFIALSLFATTSCDENADNLIVSFDENPEVIYDAKGCWNDVYNTIVGAVKFDEVAFSHLATATDWGGYVYYAWYGFCPSKSTDNTDYADGDWTSNQWGSITGGGFGGAGDPYILGCWNPSEEIERIPTAPTCSISYEGGKFNPLEVYVTNSAWGYYAMKNGSAFNKQFADGDWCILHIYGVKNGKIAGKVDVVLADGTNILDKWSKVDLTPLGTQIDMIYFQMTSSDTGIWGMNNPAYFCLDNLEIDLE